MNDERNKALVSYLSEFITEERLSSIDNVLSNRTKHITVVLEDIFQPHNASAVVRSCDCFGVQDLHIIENDNEYTLSKDVTQGSSKWVDMHQYNEATKNTISTLKNLKAKGYKVIATTPHANSYTPDTLPLDNKIALVFGTELTGISDDVRSLTDDYLTIPIHGFTESYNISVSVALCLYRLISRMKESEIDFGMTESETLDIKQRWLLSVVKNGDTYLRNFNQNYKPQ